MTTAEQRAIARPAVIDAVKALLQQAL